MNTRELGWTLQHMRQNRKRLRQIKYMQNPEDRVDN